MIRTSTPAVLCLIVLLALTAHAAAQIPPSAAEIAAYRGLHAAAARGDAGEIEVLVRAGTTIDARDSHGRTPLHVAAFMRKQDAVRTLLRLGANPNALESQQYDRSISRRCTKSLRNSAHKVEFQFPTQMAVKPVTLFPLLFVGIFAMNRRVGSTT
jgi:ankyrin repeat protein